MKSTSSVRLPTKPVEAQHIPAEEQWSTGYHLCPSTLYPGVAIAWPKSLLYFYEMFLYYKKHMYVFKCKHYDLVNTSLTWAYCTCCHKEIKKKLEAKYSTQNETCNFEINRLLVCKLKQSDFCRTSFLYSSFNLKCVIQHKSLWTEAIYLHNYYS